MAGKDIQPLFSSGQLLVGGAIVATAIGLGAAKRSNAQDKPPQNDAPLSFRLNDPKQDAKPKTPAAAPAKKQQEIQKPEAAKPATPAPHTEQQKTAATAAPTMDEVVSLALPIIKRCENEGLHKKDSCTSYDDVGYRSIGYGFNMSVHKDMFKETLGCSESTYNRIKNGKESITIEQANKLVRAMTEYKYGLMQAEIGHIKMNANQKAAILSMVYNCNTAPVKKGTAIRKALEAGDMSRAAELIGTTYIKAGGKVEQGLINRRKQERQLFETPAATSSARAMHPAEAKWRSADPFGTALVLETSGKPDVICKVGPPTAEQRVQNLQRLMTARVRSA